MKINTENGFDIICEIAPYVLNITDDIEVKEAFKQKANLKDGATEDEIKQALSSLTKAKIVTLLPLVLKKHKQDVVIILGKLNGKTDEEIKKQSIFVTAKQVLEIISDEELLSFF